MKKIAHFQIPYNNNGGFVFDFKTVNNFYHILKEQLGEDYYVVVSPLEPEISEYLKNIPMEDLVDISYNKWTEYVRGIMEGKDEK